MMLTKFTIDGITILAPTLADAKRLTVGPGTMAAQAQSFSSNVSSPINGSPLAPWKGSYAQ